LVGIADQVARHRVVGLDTPVFIYQLEGKPPLADVTTDLFRLIQAGTPTAVTSVVTMTELIVKPLELGRVETAYDYERLLLEFPNLAIVDVDLSVARLAARLRARHRLRTPDALQLAACLSAGAAAFVTNDSSLSRVQELDVVLLGDFVDRR
jgi:predicted nucleic acid-binding protein